MQNKKHYFGINLCINIHHVQTKHIDTRC